MRSVVWGTLMLVVSTAMSLDMAWGVARRCYPRDSVVALAAGTLLWPTFAVVVLEVLGVAGLLAPLPVFVVVLVLWLGYRTFATKHPGPHRGFDVRVLHRPQLTRGDWVAAVGGAGLFLLLAASVLDAWAYPHLEFDALYYHLPIPVQWLQAHNLRLLPFLGPNIQAARFPANFELTELWLMLPVHRGMFVQLAPSVGLAMTVAGVVLLARSLGARLRFSLAAALVVVTLPCVLVSLIGSGFGDLFMAGALTLAAGFLARYQTTWHRRDVVLAGAAAGLALGARYQAVLDVLPLTAIAFLILTARSPRSVRAWRDLAVAGGALIATGGYFYVRNGVATGNPLYPKAWSVAFHSFRGARLDACCEQPSWFSLGWHPRVWADSAKAILFTNHAESVTHAWGPMLGVLLALGCVIPVVSALHRRQRHVLVWAWALYPLAQVIIYLATPNSAGYGAMFALINGRFMLVPLAASAALLAVETGRLSTAGQRLVLATALLGALACTLALSSGITRSPLPPAPDFLILLLPVGIVGYFAPRIWVPRHILGVGLVALALAVIGLSPQLADHNRRNQRNLPFADAADHLSRADGVVSVVGICEVYALYGPYLQRRVTYITGGEGIDPPLGTTYSKWLAGLQRHHVTAIVDAIVPEACFPRAVPLPQTQWLKLHPGRFALRARIPGALIYSVSGATPTTRSASRPELRKSAGSLGSSPSLRVARADSRSRQPVASSRPASRFRWRPEM